MRDTTITKIDSSLSPRGNLGQRHLASGVRVALRLWENEAPGSKSSEYTQRDYEVIGYVLGGLAKLENDRQSTPLAPGDSWGVPEGALHRYEILETFSAIEATSPPAQVEARREQPARHH